MIVWFICLWNYHLKQFLRLNIHYAIQIKTWSMTLSIEINFVSATEWKSLCIPYKKKINKVLDQGQCQTQSILIKHTVSWLRVHYGKSSEKQQDSRDELPLRRQVQRTAILPQHLNITQLTAPKWADKTYANSPAIPLKEINVRNVSWHFSWVGSPDMHWKPIELSVRLSLRLSGVSPTTVKCLLVISQLLDLRVYLMGDWHITRHKRLDSQSLNHLF